MSRRTATLPRVQLQLLLLASEPAVATIDATIKSDGSNTRAMPSYYGDKSDSRLSAGTRVRIECRSIGPGEPRSGDSHREIEWYRLVTPSPHAGRFVSQGLIEGSHSPPWCWSGRVLKPAFVRKGPSTASEKLEEQSLSPNTAIRVDCTAVGPGPDGPRTEWIRLRDPNAGGFIWKDLAHLFQKPPPPACQDLREPWADPLVGPPALGASP